MELLDTRTDIGLIRDNNEDASTAIYHPKSKNLKLLIVADGMGGKEHGEFASNFVVEKLKNKSRTDWFWIFVYVSLIITNETLTII